MAEVVFPLKLPLVNSLPSPSLNERRMVYYNNKIYYSDGNSWIELGSGGGGGGGVTSLNNKTGALFIEGSQNISVSTGTNTINLDTVQNISTNDSPTFKGVIVTQDGLRLGSEGVFLAEYDKNHYLLRNPLINSIMPVDMPSTKPYISVDKIENHTLFPSPSVPSEVRQQGDDVYNFVQFLNNGQVFLFDGMKGNKYLFFYSTNRGATYNRIETIDLITMYASVGFAQMFNNGSGGFTFFVSNWRSTPSYFAYKYASYNNGQTWSLILNGYGHGPIAASKTNQYMVSFGLNYAAVSNNYGASFSQVSASYSSYDNPHKPLITPDGKIMVGVSTHHNPSSGVITYHTNYGTSSFSTNSTTSYGFIDAVMDENAVIYIFAKNMSTGNHCILKTTNFGASYTVLYELSQPVFISDTYHIRTKSMFVNNNGKVIMWIGRMSVDGVIFLYLLASYDGGTSFTLTPLTLPTNYTVMVFEEHARENIMLLRYIVSTSIPYFLSNKVEIDASKSYFNNLTAHSLTFPPNAAADKVLVCSNSSGKCSWSNSIKVSSLNLTTNAGANKVLVCTDSSGAATWTSNVPTVARRIPILRGGQCIPYISGATAMTTLALTANRTYVMPFYIDFANLYIYTIYVNVTTASSGTHYIAVYTSSSRYISDWVRYTNVISFDTSTTGTITLSFNQSYLLEPGVCYAFLWLAGSAATVRAVAGTSMYPIFSPVSGTSHTVAFYFSGLSELPSTISSTPTAIASTSAVPAVAIAYD